MYRDIQYLPYKKCVLIRTWDEQGNRIDIEEPFKPYFYVESNTHSDGTSIFNTNLRKIEFETQYDRRKYLDGCGINRLFFNLPTEQQALIRKYGNVNENPDFSKFPLKIYFLDIEVYSPNKFPIPEEANYPINLITIYDTISDMYYTFGLEKSYTPKLSNSKYYCCSSETELLKTFINFWKQDYCDLLSGWNSEGFDIPYIINRITVVLGEQWARKLSPTGRIVYRENVRQQYGKTKGRWHINGISCIDYLEAYIYFSKNEQESYALNYIAKTELGEGKLNINTTNLAKLADTNWENFVDYNIQDVTLLKKLEDKLRFLKIVRMVSYKGLTKFESALGKIAIITGVVALQALKQNKIIPTFIYEEQGNYAGGFVKDIDPGLKEDVVTFDANSLYPNTLITLNLSPETKIGKIISHTDTHIEIKLVNGEEPTKLTHEQFLKFLEIEKLSISQAKILYSQKIKGIMPQVVDKLYDERIQNKNKMIEHQRALVHCKKDSDKYKEHKRIIDQLDIMQYTLKILLNAIYGTFANKHSPFYDIDAASSITLTGQAVAKIASRIINDYAIEKFKIQEPITHYNDTDSLHFSLKSIFDKIQKPFVDKENNITRDVYQITNELNDHLNKQITVWAQKTLHTKDSRFFFKREAICLVGIYQSKKHYILHIKDKGETDPIPCDEIKYVGVEVAKSTMSENVKNLIKEIIKNIVYTKSNEKTNEIYRQAFEKFKILPIEDIAFRSNISDYDKYEKMSEGFVIGKKTPMHCKSAIFYNKLLKERNLDTKYENVTSGMKIKYFYCRPNSYNIKSIAFVDKFPTELTDIQPDYDLMFQKIVAPAIERMYESVGWRKVDLRNEYVCDIFDLFLSNDVEK